MPRRISSLDHRMRPFAVALTLRLAHPTAKPVSVAHAKTACMPWLILSGLYPLASEEDTEQLGLATWLSACGMRTPVLRCWVCILFTCRRAEHLGCAAAERRHIARVEAAAPYADDTRRDQHQWAGQ